MAVFLESTNRKFGKVTRGSRADEEGVYNRGVRMNFLAAICGDEAIPMRWQECWVDEGTIAERYYVFMMRVLIYLAEHHPGRSFCFTEDNLNAHKILQSSSKFIIVVIG